MAVVNGNGRVPAEWFKVVFGLLIAALSAGWAWEHSTIVKTGETLTSHMGKQIQAEQATAESLVRLQSDISWIRAALQKQEK